MDDITLFNAGNGNGIHKYNRITIGTLQNGTSSGNVVPTPIESYSMTMSDDNMYHEHMFWVIYYIKNLNDGLTLGSTIIPNMDVYPRTHYVGPDSDNFIRSLTIDKTVKGDIVWRFSECTDDYGNIDSSRIVPRYIYGIR